MCLGSVLLACPIRRPVPTVPTPTAPAVEPAAASPAAVLTTAERHQPDATRPRLAQASTKAMHPRNWLREEWPPGPILKAFGARRASSSLTEAWESRGTAWKFKYGQRSGHRIDDRASASIRPLAGAVDEGSRRVVSGGPWPADGYASHSNYPFVKTAKIGSTFPLPTTTGQTSPASWEKTAAMRLNQGKPVVTADVSRVDAPLVLPETFVGAGPGGDLAAVGGHDLGPQQRRLAKGVRHLVGVPAGERPRRTFWHSPRQPRHEPNNAFFIFFCFCLAQLRIAIFYLITTKFFYRFKILSFWCPFNFDGGKISFTFQFPGNAG